MMHVLCTKCFQVYVAGPLAGCIVGAVLYTQVFITSPKTERTRKLTESGRSAEGKVTERHETTCSSLRVEMGISKFLS